ncbi:MULTISPECIES: hypothetical protein [unclassified Streptomyces]|uniref:hypothetical protein n=1 Tax=unclassified Streptomyces TaxID=2593676 RepID=UPI0033F80C46
MSTGSKVWITTASCSKPTNGRVQSGSPYVAHCGVRRGASCRSFSSPLPQLLKPLAQFGRRELVDDSAPRLFAVVQVYGKEEDGIAAWGMALDDHAEIIDVEGRVRMNVRSPERGVRRFAHPPHISARLMWVREQPAG